MVYDVRDPIMEEHRAHAQKRLARQTRIETSRTDVSFGLGLIILTLAALAIGALIIFMPGSTPVSEDGVVGTPVTPVSPDDTVAPTLGAPAPVPAPVPGSSD